MAPLGPRAGIPGGPRQGNDIQTWNSLDSQRGLTSSCHNPPLLLTFLNSPPSSPSHTACPSPSIRLGCLLTAALPAGVSAGVLPVIGVKCSGLGRPSCDVSVWPCAVCMDRRLRSEEEKSNLWIGTAGDELSMMDFNGLCYKNKQEWLGCGVRSEAFNLSSRTEYRYDSLRCIPATEV